MSSNLQSDVNKIRLVSAGKSEIWLSKSSIVVDINILKIQVCFLILLIAKCGLKFSPIFKCAGCGAVAG